MIIYTINPDPWELIFWTATVMAGAGLFAAVGVYIILSYYMRELRQHHERVYRRMTSMERRMAVMERAVGATLNSKRKEPTPPGGEEDIKILR